MYLFLFILWFLTWRLTEAEETLRVEGNIFRVVTMFQNFIVIFMKVCSLKHLFNGEEVTEEAFLDAYFVFFVRIFTLYKLSFNLDVVLVRHRYDLGCRVRHLTSYKSCFLTFFSESNM